MFLFKFSENLLSTHVRFFNFDMFWKVYIYIYIYSCTYLLNWTKSERAIPSLSLCQKLNFNSWIQL